MCVGGNVSEQERAEALSDHRELVAARFLAALQGKKRHDQITLNLWTGRVVWTLDECWRRYQALDSFLGKPRYQLQDI